MKSHHDLPEFSDWVKWPSRAVSQAPAKPGVYKFRLDREISRLCGASDLLYVGKTGSLASRLKQHRPARTDGTGVGLACKHIEKRNLGVVQVAWHPCNDAQEAAGLESKLLAEYKDNHLELPPLNGNEPNKRKGQTLRNFREALEELLGEPMDHQMARRFVDFARQKLSE